jgi:hypothetical protein
MARRTGSRAFHRRLSSCNGPGSSGTADGARTGSRGSWRPSCRDTLCTRRPASPGARCRAAAGPRCGCGRGPGRRAREGRCFLSQPAQTARDCNRIRAATSEVCPNLRKGSRNRSSSSAISMSSPVESSSVQFHRGSFVRGMSATSAKVVSSASA